MVAVGMSQLLGVSRGFWCLCTPVPKVVQTADCAPATCHAGEASCAEPGAAHDEDHPDEGGHRHHEARESLMTVAVATTVPLPVPVVSELPPSVLVAPPCAWTVVQPGHEARLAWIGDGSPPMPLLVARTVVRRV